MSRLTERLDSDGLCYGKIDCEDNCSYCDRFLKVLDKLADYEDKEEQGLLIELPVAEGSEVWTIMCGMTGKHPILFKQNFELAMLKHWGTAVFATRSEAEEALAKMGGK